MSARFVFVHGLRASRSMWRPQLEALAEVGAPTVAVDLPGHGVRIGHEFTVDGAVAAIAEGVRSAREAEADPGPVVLVGLSLGGYLAMETVGRDPGLVDGLVAIGCSTRPHRFGLALYRRWAVALAAMPDGGRRLDEAASTLIHGRQFTVDLLSGGHGIAASASAVASLADLEPLVSMARAGAAGLPVWFVNGQFDQFRLEERRFLEATRGSRLTVVPGGTHVLNLSKPRGVNAILLAIAAASC